MVENCEVLNMARAYSLNERNIINLIRDDTGVQEKDAKIILSCISQNGFTQDKFSSFTSFPDSKPGMMQMMVMINKYNINISKLALTAISFLLGLIPVVGNTISSIELIHNLSDCIEELSDTEKALLIYLREISNNATISVSIDGIYKGFICEDNKNKDFNNKKSINSLLDSLADKGLIEIRTNKVIVKN